MNIVRALAYVKHVIYGVIDCLYHHYDTFSVGISLASDDTCM